MEIFFFMILIVGAFVVQSFLGFLQIKHFTKHYSELRRLGRVAIGKKTGRFRAGTIVLFAVNNNGRILKAKKIQGVTVMAGIKELPGFTDKNIRNIKEEDMSHCNKLMRVAIKDACSNYKIIMGGGTIPVKEAFFKRMLGHAESAFKNMKR